ncbi:MAG: hypothetical protein Q8M68_16630 [Polaromonas sp.]|nr:hypothetical protein [Polaromonas sp.]
MGNGRGNVAGGIGAQRHQLGIGLPGQPRRYHGVELAMQQVVVVRAGALSGQAA